MNCSSTCSHLVGFCVVPQTSFGLFESRSRGWVLDLNTNPENYAYGPCFLNEDDRWDRIAKEEDIKEARKEAYGWVYCDDEEDEYYEEGDCCPVSFPPTEEELVEEARWLLDEEMDRRYARKAA